MVAHVKLEFFQTISCNKSHIGTRIDQKRNQDGRADEALVGAARLGELQTLVALNHFAQHLERAGDMDAARIATALHQAWQDDLVRNYPEEGIRLARQFASNGQRREAIEVAHTIIESMQAIEESWSPARDHRRMAIHDLSGWLRNEGDIQAAITCLEPVAQELLDEGAASFLKKLS